MESSDDYRLKECLYSRYMDKEIETKKAVLLKLGLQESATKILRNIDDVTCCSKVKEMINQIRSIS